MKFLSLLLLALFLVWLVIELVGCAYDYSGYRLGPAEAVEYSADGQETGRRVYEPGEFECSPTTL